MSRLRVLWPDEVDTDGGVALEEPAVIPFGDAGEIAGHGPMFDVIERARLLYDNRCCPSCHYPVVEPIELADGVRNRKGQVIPGTATLVGFRCRGCRSEWAT
ncbi:hypothetical protein GC163_08985 [bacterium]|nr:hypothetical protein [bacterium]